MCRGSLLVRNTEEAEVGALYQISDGGDVGFRAGVLHRPGFGARVRGGAIACAACIKTPTKVFLTDIPDETQRQFGVEPFFNATFMPAAEAASHEDWIELDSGRKIPLSAFIGEGVRLMVLPTTERKRKPMKEARTLELA